MPLCHVDECVKSHPRKSRGVNTGVLKKFTRMWKDRLNCYTLLCLCRTRGCVRSLARSLSSSSVFCTLSPYFLKVEWKHKELMQGDWMSSLSRLNRCADPRGLVKKVQTADVIRPSSLLPEWFHKALRSLIRLLRTSQWDIDFPAPLLQLSQFSCLTDWWSRFYRTRSVVLPSLMYRHYPYFKRQSSFVVFCFFLSLDISLY